MIFSEPVLDFIESAFVFGNSAKDIADHILADRYSKAVHSQNVICQLESCPLLAVVEGMEGDEMQCQGGLPEVIGLFIDPGNEIVNGAPAQDSRQTQ